MNQFVVKSQSGKMYGPFKNAQAAAKWAHKNLLGSWGRPIDWSILRLFGK